MPKYIFSLAESRLLFQHEAFKPSDQIPQNEKKNETPAAQPENKHDETNAEKNQQERQPDDPREIYWQTFANGQKWSKEIESEISGIDFRKASAQELILATKEKSPLAIALLLNYASDKLASNEQRQQVPDQQKAMILSEVKKILLQDDVSVDAYGAALAFLMRHGSADQLRDYLKNADDFLRSTIAEENSAVEKYNAAKAKSVQAAKKPDKKGSKSFFLEENPNQSSEFFSRYASLVMGYTAAAERGQDVSKQMERLLAESSFNYVTYLLGKMLLDTKQFQKFEHLFCIPENSTKRNALVAALGQNLDDEERDDTTKQGIRDISRKLIEKQLDPPLTPVQENELKSLSR
tara:strand:+ start:1581 stop:2630 length:1050 start_codon:yes stop_codon:yes gene_type:complete